MKRMIPLFVALALSVPALAQEPKPADKPAQEPPKAPEKKPEPPKQPETPKKDEKKDEKKPEEPAKEQLVYVVLKTSMGDITLELNQTKAPISVANFLSYVEKGHYNGTIFHRVINGFMIQGGGFEKTESGMKEKSSGKGIKNEWQNGLKNNKYTIAMARIGGQADSATSQFFINTVNNGGLDQPRDGAGYAVFGKVIAGTDVVDKIEAVKVQNRPGVDHVPLEPITITEAKKLSDDEAAKFKTKK